MCIKLSSAEQLFTRCIIAILGPLCRGDGWNYIEDSCYWISSYNTSYDEAFQSCHQMVRIETFNNKYT